MKCQWLKNEKNRIDVDIKNAYITKVWRICTIGILVASIVVLFMGGAQALTNSGGGSWQYDRIITINNNGSTLTNYQVLVNLTGTNFPANAQISGADIRFTDANGTELSYWIENFDRANKTANIWVKVADIQTSTSITMYYGNPSASGASNGAATFDLFDDFLGSNLDTSKWSKSGSATVNNGYVRINNSGSALTSLSSFGNVDIVFVTRSAVSDNTKFFIGLGSSSSFPPNNGAHYQIGWDRNGAWYDWEMWTDQNGAWSHFDMGNPSSAANVWEKIEIKRLSGNTAYYLNDVLKVTHTNVPTVSMPFQISTNWSSPASNSQPNDVDYVRVRKYASPEPSVSVGIEQSTGPAPQKGFRFVQLTDVHIGPDIECYYYEKYPDNLIFRSNLTNCLETSFQNSAESFINTINDIKISSDPDFIIITGDLVEWNQMQQYEKLNELLDRFSIKVYTVPGNHDRRGLENPMDSKSALSGTMCPEILGMTCFNDLTHYNNLNKFNDKIVRIDESDKVFPHGDFRFIGLDSGYDAGLTSGILQFRLAPTGSGLSDEQKDIVNNNIIDGKTIIFMHHPAIDDERKDNSLNVISENRIPFIRSAESKHVKLVLAGHTHYSKFFDRYGKSDDEDGRKIDAISNSISAHFKDTFSNIIKEDYNDTLENIQSSSNNVIKIIRGGIPISTPLFVQTRSATKHDGKDIFNGYLNVIVADNGQVQLEDVIFTETTRNSTTFILHSPADIHIYDEYGRHTGMNSTGSVENNIPDSYYFEELKIGNITLPSFVQSYNTSLNYNIEIVSNFSKENIIADRSTFNFTIKQKTRDSTKAINYNNVLINRDSKVHLRLNNSQADYSMLVDVNNDGITDTTKMPDTIITDHAPTTVILSPSNNSVWDQGQPVTFNGTGIDIEDGTLTTLTWISDRDDVIGHGNFTISTLSAGVHNIILRVIDSAGQVKTSNILITVTDTKPPILEIDSPTENKIFNKQNINLEGIAYDDSGIQYVNVNGIAAGNENWKATIGLQEGLNIIEIVAMDNKGFNTTAHRKVYYNSSLASDIQPPAAITNLTYKTGLDKSGRAWINWTWDNPEDQDFSYAIVYIDNIPMGNTSRSYFSLNGLSKDAIYNISILSSDIVDNINYSEVKETVKTLPPDSIPPVTAIALSGIPGSNEWFTSDVQINLAADDNEEGTGVAVTEFSFDNVNWSTYFAPFNISNEGITRVFYRSTDNVGNIESTRNKSIKIDKTKPNISISTVVDGSHYNSNVTPVISIIDTNLNNQTVVLNGAQFTSSNVVSVEGNYTLVASAGDLAGNTASKIVNFVIDRTPPEAAISFNNSSKDIKVYSSQTEEEINYLVIPPKKGNHDDKKSDEEEKGWELRSYTLKDLAGNLFELVLIHKKEGNEVKVKVISMQYNGGSIIDAPKNEIQVSYSTGKNSSFKELEQKIEVEKELAAEAKYGFKENKTEIKMKLEGQKEQKLTRAGIVILKLITERSGLNLK